MLRESEEYVMLSWCQLCVLSLSAILINVVEKGVQLVRNFSKSIGRGGDFLALFVVSDVLDALSHDTVFYFT